MNRRCPVAQSLRNTAAAAEEFNPRASRSRRRPLAAQRPARVSAAEASAPSRFASCEDIDDAYQNGAHKAIGRHSAIQPCSGRASSTRASGPVGDEVNAVKEWRIMRE